MIWITQWLCPSRHCSIALAWDDKETTPEKVEEEGEGIYHKGMINRWCGICGADLHVEHGRTRFKTMDEAMPKLKAIEKANLVGRNILGMRW